MKYINLSFVLLCFLLLSCGKKEDNIDNKPQNQLQHNSNQDTAKINHSENQTPNNRNKMNQELTPEKTITAFESKDYVGKVVTVKGYIADVYKADSVEFLNFEQKFPKNPLSGVIFKEKFSEFGDINDFLHKDVELTGMIKLYKEKPEIIIKSKSQIIITK